MTRKTKHISHAPVPGSQTLRNVAAKFVAAYFDAYGQNDDASRLRDRIASNSRRRLAARVKVGVSGASAAGLSRCAYTLCKPYNAMPRVSSELPLNTAPIPQGSGTATEQIPKPANKADPNALYLQFHAPANIASEHVKTRDFAETSPAPVTGIETKSTGRNLGFTGEERRHTADRRTFTPNTLWQCLVNPRRSKGRRRTDKRYAMLDVFDGSSMFLAVALVVLSLCDAFFTLNILARGGSEVNPVMNYMLGHGTFAFVASKMFMTVVAVVALVGAGNLKIFNMLRVRSVLATLIGLYAGLIAYELILLSMA